MSQPAHNKLGFTEAEPFFSFSSIVAVTVSSRGWAPEVVWQGVFQGASTDLALWTHTCHGSFLLRPDPNMVDNSPTSESGRVSTANNQSEVEAVHLQKPELPRTHSMAQRQ